MLISRYEDEVSSYKAARQQAVEALDKVTNERDHARKMQKLEVGQLVMDEVTTK